MALSARVFDLEGYRRVCQMGERLLTGEPLLVEVKPYEEKRRSEQNRLMWALLRRISGQLTPNGVAYSSEVWHEHLKREFLGYREMQLPTGQLLVLPRSTTDLSVRQFADYLESIFAFAAEHGVDTTGVDEERMVADD